jgi:AcrR family transcriptional regulator
MGVTERKAKEKEELKSLILKAATKLFIEKGIEYTTIRNIADEIEYSVGTVYVYFKDKNAILYEIHCLYFQVLHRQLTGAMKIEDPFERLKGIAKAYVAFALNNPELYDLIFIMNAPIDYLKNSDLEEHGEWREGKHTFTLLCEAVEACRNAGYFGTQQIETFSLACWAVVHGLCSLYIRNRLSILDVLGIEIEVEKALNSFINVLKNKL